MNLTETIGTAHQTDVDLRGLRCLICGSAAETTTMRVTRIEDGCWLAVCDDCCEFFAQSRTIYAGGRRAPGAAPFAFTTPPRTPRRAPPPPGTPDFKADPLFVLHQGTGVEDVGKLADWYTGTLVDWYTGRLVKW